MELEQELVLELELELEVELEGLELELELVAELAEYPTSLHLCNCVQQLVAQRYHLSHASTTHLLWKRESGYDGAEACNWLDSRNTLVLNEFAGWEKICSALPQRLLLLYYHSHRCTSRCQARPQSSLDHLERESIAGLVCLSTLQGRCYLRL